MIYLIIMIMIIFKSVNHIHVIVSESNDQTNMDMMDKDNEQEEKRNRSHAKLKPGIIKKTVSLHEATKNKKQSLRMQKSRILNNLKKMASK